MRYRPIELACLLALYAVLVLSPLLIGILGNLPPGRRFTTELAVALGFLAFGFMVLQFVLTGRFRGIGSQLGLDKMLQFHRQAGVLAVVFVLAHAGIFLLYGPLGRQFLDPRINLPRAAALTAAVLGLGALLITSLWRKTFRLQYEHWRLLHGVVAALVLVVGLAHVLKVGHYVSTLGQRAGFVILTLAGLGFYVHGRLIRPFRMLRHPYRVVDCRERSGSCWSLRLEPDGHEGLNFEPGQFVWLTLGDTPFTLQQHPFSLSSSAEQTDVLELTIKDVGDFTSTVKHVTPGTRAYLEGPYGSFTPDPESNRDLVLIAGGIGIAPMMSILRTLQDRGDPRSLHLLYAAREEESLTFGDAIQQMREEGFLRSTTLLEHAGEDWQGPRGRITGELLERSVPLETDQARYFVCGPEPMLEQVEELLIDRGIPLRDIFTEQFRIV